MRRLTALSLALGLLASTALTPARADDMVKIGVLSDMGGPLSAITGPGAVIAAELAIEDFGGTVAGRKIELVQADHQNKADVGAAVAQEWLTSDGIDAIVDGAGSAVALAVQELARNEKKVFLITGASGSVLTGKACSPYGIHWSVDTYGLAQGTGKLAVQDVGKSWFFLTADYAFGHALEADASKVVQAAGGTVVGHVLHPFNTPDFSSFLLQAQASGAAVIGMAHGAGDLINAVKQAHEFGVGAPGSGQSLVGLLVFITDVNSIGLEAAQGLTVTNTFYWDMNDETRAFAERFKARSGGQPPTMMQAGSYGAVLHYLKAVEATGTDDADTVLAKMREMPINDVYTKNGSIRADGRVLRDYYLWRVKSPAESKGSWDYLTLVGSLPAEEAARPLGESECPLVKSN